MNPRTPLVTRRLRLEPVEGRHAEGLYQAARASRAELLPWMPWAIDITLEGDQHDAADAAGATRPRQASGFSPGELASAALQPSCSGPASRTPPAAGWRRSSAFEIPARWQT